MKDPQSQNRYAYVRNNPVTRVDPNGLGIDGGCGDPEDPLCDPCILDPFLCLPPPIGGGGGYNGGGGEGPKPRTFPWPLLPLGFFQDNSRQTLKLNRATCTEKGSGLVELQCWWSSPTQTFSSLGATRCTYPASDEGPGRCVNDHVVNGDTTISCAPDITIDQKCNDSTVQGPFFIYVTHRVGRPQ